MLASLAVAIATLLRLLSAEVSNEDTSAESRTPLSVDCHYCCWGKHDRKRSRLWIKPMICLMCRDTLHPRIQNRRERTRLCGSPVRRVYKACLLLPSLVIVKMSDGSGKGYAAYFRRYIVIYESVASRGGCTRTHVAKGTGPWDREIS